ncbi:MAG TPA: DUF1800 domain-containing protein [Actinopolymorphaceae bacterium]|jgi:uncharacterized protein (DUF1800 family)
MPDPLGWAGSVGHGRVVALLDEPDAIRRALDRFGFGADAAQLATARHAGWDATVAGFFRPAAGGPDTVVPTLPLIARPGKDASAADKKKAAQGRKAQQLQIVIWWLDQMVVADHGLTERMTWFWHGHFATSVQKVKSAPLMLAQNETLRSDALATFEKLAHAMIVDPAMLVWLDGNDNVVGAANENLAREFMELFSIGHGAYSEDDVREAARALTGWTVKRATGKARFGPRRHDDTAKTILGTTADFDAGSFVDLVCAQPASPPFLISRVWARLVGPLPLTTAVDDRLVAAYGSSGDITALLRAVLAEHAFRDRQAGLVKQPVEWLAGLMRALRVRPSGLDPKEQRELAVGLRGMGQVPFLPPSVGGWPAGGAWLTTSAAVARLHTAKLVAGRADLKALTAASRLNRITAVGQLLGVGTWTTRTRNALAAAAGEPVALVVVAAVSPEYVVSG